ncbi:MAG: phosphate signaling complex protein PhoU [Candidatus Deferrimicrobiaceae bacterium]
MTREAYDRALQSLEEEFQALGRMVGAAIRESVAALKARDLGRAREIIRNDLVINRKRFEIEERCFDLIATQQPAAVDLRTIGSILIMASDLERMGDHAEGIAKISLMLGDKPLVKPLIDVPRMAEKGLSMLDRCLLSFARRDAGAARAICSEDDEVDALHDQVYRELLVLMIANPHVIEGATFLLWVAHNLERIADRVTNIAERVVFVATGKMEELNVSKY